MKIQKGLNGYLGGITFSNELKMKIADSEPNILFRFDLIKQYVTKKTVIHLGCADHHSLINEKSQNKCWLHDIIIHEAVKCLGIEINNEAVEYLKNSLGYQDIICADIIREPNSLILEQKWDYLLIGEVLEHVDNPVYFLTRIKYLYSGHIDKIILTVPNAFSFYNIISSLHHEENINSDHRYWFTPYTLAKIASISGMEIEDFYFCEISKQKIIGFKLLLHPKVLLKYFLLKRYPAFRETIFIILKIGD